MQLFNPFVMLHLPLPQCRQHQIKVTTPYKK